MGWRVKRANRPILSPEAQWRRKRKRGTAAGLDGELQLSALNAYMRRFREAERILEAAAKKWPRDPRIAIARTTVRQLSGDFSPAQWQDPRLLDRARSEIPHTPLWQGEAMPGETLLIRDIHTGARRVTGPTGFGAGDIIQLARMLAPVKAQSRAARLIFQVPKELVPIMQSLPGPDLMVDQVPTDGFDRHYPLVCTPAYVPLTHEIFWGVPYLHAAPESIARGAPTFADRHVTHIGIHFAADPKHLSARERSIPLKVLAPLFDIPGTRWYSFQKGAAAEVAAYPQLVDLGDFDTAEPLMETAGALHHLDLLIACDSGPAHLAGALAACPVWLLLNFCFDARWTLSRDGTTPWYRHQLFAQTQPDDWPGVVEEVRYELEQALLHGSFNRTT